jgi:hypothetical protein
MSGSNGGNPRLDRIEKLIEQSERANKEAHARHEIAHARHDREMRQIRDNLRRWTVLGVKEARNQRKRVREIDESITRLAAAQLVTEEKQQRVDESITRLAAAQLVTEEKLQRFILSLKRGPNGR